MKELPKKYRIEVIKKIIAEEHERDIRAIREESKVANYSYEFQGMSLAYLHELESIQSETALDDFLRQYRNLTLDEWIESL